MDLGAGVAAALAISVQFPAAFPGAVLCEADPDLALTVGAINVRGALKYGYLMWDGSGHPAP